MKVVATTHLPNVSHSINSTEAIPRLNDTEQTTKRQFPVIYGPPGTFERPKGLGGVLGSQATGQLVGDGSDNTLGIIMVLALIGGIVLMIFGWKRSGESLPDDDPANEESGVDGSREESSADAGVSQDAAAVSPPESEPSTSGAVS